jgi:hypothetical protein
VSRVANPCSAQRISSESRFVAVGGMAAQDLTVQVGTEVVVARGPNRNRDRRGGAGSGGTHREVRASRCGLARPSAASATAWVVRAGCADPAASTKVSNTPTRRRARRPGAEALKPAQFRGCRCRSARRGSLRRMRPVVRIHSGAFKPNPHRHSRCGFFISCCSSSQACTQGLL